MAQNPIVIAHHLIWTAYGWWLPNDPRGSMSRTIRCDVIADLGELHFGRKRIQPASNDLRSFFREADKRLMHDMCEFDEDERALLGEVFAHVVENNRYTCWACAIMPDHIHLLIRKHKHKAEDMIAQFQNSSRSRLRDLHTRTIDHPIWGGPGWKVFLDHSDEVRRIIGYIENTPSKSDYPRNNGPS